MAKVITLTADQKTQIAMLDKAAKDASGAAGKAQKAYRDYLETIIGAGGNPFQRPVISGDGNSLIVV